MEVLGVGQVAPLPENLYFFLRASPNSTQRVRREAASTQLTARRSTAARSASNELTKCDAATTANATSRRLHEKPRVLSEKKDPAKLPRNRLKGAGKRTWLLDDFPEWKEAEKSGCI